MGRERGGEGGRREAGYIERRTREKEKKVGRDETDERDMREKRVELEV